MQSAVHSAAELYLERSGVTERSGFTYQECAGYTVTLTCPKCASSEGKSIEAIYCECITPEKSQRALSAELSRQSAPPGKRHPAWWMIVAGLFIVAAGFSGIARDSTTLALLTCAALAGLMAHDADRYNQLDLPRLLEYWHRAFMCERCGEVFVPG